MIIFNVVTKCPEKFKNVMENELQWLRCEYLREVVTGIHEFMCTSRVEINAVISLENLHEVFALTDLNEWELRIRID